MMIKKIHFLSTKRALALAFMFGAAMFIILDSFAQSTATPGPSIEISATIYDFRYDKDTQFGVFYQYNRNSGAFQNSNVFLQGTENINDVPIPALDLSGNFARLNYGTIEYNIKTAIEEGRGTVFSNPSILVSDGEEAQLISGEEVPITEVKLSGNKTTLAPQNRNTGIKLIVTPHIYKGNNILMQLEVESSEITRFSVFDRGDGERYELPVIATRNIKSVVIIPNQKSLYIGGLYTDISSDITRKVPILGDVPGLGFFLRGFNKSRSRAETVFKIVPIIRDPGFGITRQDYSIFSDLLEPEGSDEIINQYQALEQIPSERASAKRSLNAAGEVNSATQTDPQETTGSSQRSSAGKKRPEVKRFRIQ